SGAIHFSANNGSNGQALHPPMVLGRQTARKNGPQSMRPQLKYPPIALAQRCAHAYAAHWRKAMVLNGNKPLASWPSWPAPARNVTALHVLVGLACARGHRAPHNETLN